MARRWTIAVIGCGNIGSRHLQGLARLQHPSDIYGIEPIEAHLTQAKGRVDEIPPQENLSFKYHATLDALPPSIDLAVVVTGASTRRDALHAVLAGRTVRALILEKFLFQRLVDYDDVERLLTSRGIPTWVNTPRRAWPGYQALQKRILGQGPFTLLADGDGRNRLATSVIHFVDMGSFLFGSDLPFELDGSQLRVSDKESRHSGVIEFDGVMTGRSEKGDCLVLRSRPNSEPDRLMTIMTDTELITIDEGDQKVRFEKAEGPYSVTQSEFPIVFQSSLTGTMARNIIDYGRCELPTFAASARLHRECLKAFLQALGQSRDNATYVCAVT